MMESSPVVIRIMFMGRGRQNILVAYNPPGDNKWKHCRVFERHRNLWGGAGASGGAGSGNPANSPTAVKLRMLLRRFPKARIHMNPTYMPILRRWGIPDEHIPPRCIP